MTAFILELAIRTALIALGTAAVLRLFHIQAPAVRHAAWTGVLIAMLCLPMWQAGGIRLLLPVLDQTPSAARPGADREPAATGDISPARDSVAPLREPAASAAQPTPSGPAVASVDWQALLLSVYGVGALVLLLRLALGTVAVNCLRRNAMVREGRLTSSRCATPITVGWLRPSLILPDGWEHWPSAKVGAVLTHEREHARRRDPLVQWLALLNRAVFWFHPLSWWLERRLSTLSEAACDAAVLAAGHSPQEYSEYLIEMARSVSQRHGRVQLVGMAMPGTGLSERLRGIYRGLPAARISRTRAICTVAFCAVSSAIFAAGTPSPRSTDQHASTGSPLTPPALPAMKITFEVISIRPCLPDPNAGGRGGSNSPRFSISPGWVRWGCVTLGQLIENAWGGGSFPNNALLNTILVPPGHRPDAPRRIRGGPSWIDGERYAIEIKISGDTTNLTGSAHHAEVNGAIGAQLRAMIEDRFQLKLRKATEEQPMYALTVAAGGLKMTPTAPSRCWVRSRFTPPEQATPPPGFEGMLSCDYGAVQRGNARGNISLEYTNISLKDLAKELSEDMDRYVLDKTGVDGRFTFPLLFAPDDRTPSFEQTRLRNAAIFASMRAENGVPPAPPREAVTPDGPTIFKALEAFGLKLESTRGPAEYLLIESVQRPRPN